MWGVTYVKSSEKQVSGMYINKFGKTEVWRQKQKRSVLLREEYSVT